MGSPQPVAPNVVLYVSAGRLVGETSCSLISSKVSYVPTYGESHERASYIAQGMQFLVIKPMCSLNGYRICTNTLDT